MPFVVHKLLAQDTLRVMVPRGDRSSRLRCASMAIAVALGWTSLALEPREASAEELEFALRMGAAVPTETDSYQPAAAPSGGVTALVRLGHHFAAGASLDTLWLSWHSPPGGDGRFDGPLEFPEDGTRSTLYALTARYYPFVDSSFLPFVEGSMGYASVSMPNGLECQHGSGFSGGLALGMDWWASGSTRLGMLAGARPLRSARVPSLTSACATGAPSAYNTRPVMR